MKSFVDRVGRRRLFAWAYLAQIAVLHLAFLVLVPSAYADDCAIDPTRAEDCLRTPGFAQNLGTGVAVLGVILVNGVAIQTIILQTRNPKDKDKDKDEDPPVTFTLDIRTQDSRSALKPDGKDSLWVFACVTCSDPKVDCSGMTASISFSPSGANGDWLQIPQSNYDGGYQSAVLMAVNPNPALSVPAPDVSLRIGAYVPGGSLSAALPLQVSQEVELRAFVGGGKEAPMHFDRETKEWRFPEIVLYFAPPGESKPVKPGFQYGFPQPPFETTPPEMFDLVVTTTQDDGLSYCLRLRLKDPQDLARQFGPNLDQNGGRIEVKITATDDQQKSYVATVAYLLRPELVMLTWGFEEDSRARADKHTYKEREFGEYEFVIDGEDELNIAAIFVRSDLLEEGRDPSDSIVDAVDCCVMSKAELVGTGSGKFELVKAEASEGTTVFEFKVRAKQGLLATAANQDVKLTLDLGGHATGDAVRIFGGTEVSSLVKLEPRLLYLKLLVVPGENQGTSYAVAYVGTTPGQPQGLRDVPLQLESKALGSGPTLVPRNPNQSTNVAGVALWELDYRGMSWTAMPEARFHVRCGLVPASGDPTEATYCEIDVRANGAAYVEALTQAAGRLELSNPHWKSTGKLGDYLWPDSLTGPINNVCSMISGHHTFEHFTCGQLRERIWGFSIERRFSNDPAVAASMNGLDFGKYEIAPIHVFFGLNPAGSEDPYFIDPWWDQSFNPDKVLLTYASETVKLGSCVALLVSTGAAILVALGQVGALATAATLITNWLTYGFLGGSYVTLEVTYHYLGYGFHIGKTPIGGEPWISPNGRYNESPSKWGEAFFRDPHMKTGTVQPLEPW